MGSATLIPDTGTNLNVTGNKFKADGYSGGDGLHTVGIYLADFIGRVMIQGSLVVEPADTDWFNITLDGEAVNYLQYDTNTSSLVMRNFTGNFVWVRAKVDRSYIVPAADPNAVGGVTQIIMNN